MKSKTYSYRHIEEERTTHRQRDTESLNYGRNENYVYICKLFIISSNSNQHICSFIETVNSLISCRCHLFFQEINLHFQFGDSILNVFLGNNVSAVCHYVAFLLPSTSMSLCTSSVLFPSVLPTRKNPRESRAYTN